MVALVGLCAWSPATAEQNAEIGVLACDVSGAVDAGKSSTAMPTQARHILCAFRLKNGVEEIYTGKAQVVNLPAKDKSTLLWRVKASSAGPPPPGFLQQSYANDPKTPPGQTPDMIGDAKSGIVLHSMVDKKEGSAGAKAESPPQGVSVLEVELKLKSSTG